MFPDLNFNHQIQRKASVGLPTIANQQSFIKIQNIGDVSQGNTLNKTSNFSVGLIKSPFEIAQALNQGQMIDMPTIDQSISQVQQDLNQNKILIKVLENAKTQILQNELNKFSS